MSEVFYCALRTARSTFPSALALQRWSAEMEKGSQARRAMVLSWVGQPALIRLIDLPVTRAVRWIIRNVEILLRSARKTLISFVSLAISIGTIPATNGGHWLRVAKAVVALEENASRAAPLSAQVNAVGLRMPALATATNLASLATHVSARRVWFVEATANPAVWAKPVLVL